VPLLQASDLGTIFETIRPRAKTAGMDGNRDQLYNFFVQVGHIKSLYWPLLLSRWLLQ